MVSSSLLREGVTCWRFVERGCGGWGWGVEWGAKLWLIIKISTLHSFPRRFCVFHSSSQHTFSYHTSEQERKKRPDKDTYITVNKLVARKRQTIQDYYLMRGIKYVAEYTFLSVNKYYTFNLKNQEKNRCKCTSCKTAPI